MVPETTGPVQRSSEDKSKRTSAAFESRTVFALCETTSWKYFATSSLTLSCFFASSSFFSPSWNCDGSIFGNNTMAKGRANSIRGTTTKNENGSILAKSAPVDTSRFRSRRDTDFPVEIFFNMRKATLTSAASNLQPVQKCETNSTAPFLLWFKYPKKFRGDLNACTKAILFSFSSDVWAEPVERARLRRGFEATLFNCWARSMVDIALKPGARRWGSGAS
mmetsp:Transcript_14310/g.57796  ORF Transcript_14310/g.57796 Transcript_14310/m.57796 type:complete len:221 (+) Transcript_14310:3972-4634(+)